MSQETIFNMHLIFRVRRVAALLSHVSLAEAQVDGAGLSAGRDRHTA